METKKEKLKFIDKLYFALVRTNVGNRGLRTDWDRYCDAIEQSEKDHRKSTWGGSPRSFGLTVPQTVRLFAVKYLMEFRAGNFEYEDLKGRTTVHRVPNYQFKDIFCLKLECLQAQALWEDYKSEIRKAISRPDARKFIAEIDYVDLIE